MRAFGLSLIAPGLLACSLTWMGYEVAQRVVKPATFDEKGRIAEFFKTDPKVGDAFPILTAAGSRVAFVWIGDCNQCAAHAVPPEQLQAACPIGTQLVLLAPSADRRAFPNPFAGQKIVSISRDQQKAINAFFAPRAYIVEDGRLQQIQAPAEQTISVIKR